MVCVHQYAARLSQENSLSKIKMTQQPLDFVLEFSQGKGELAVDTAHPVVAPFRRSIEEGKPTGTWHYLIISDLPTLPYTIVGTFVKTPKGRVLFFPGAAIGIETDDPTACFNGKRLDHITADPPRTAKLSSHIAVQGLPHDESRGLSYRSALPPKHRFPWFSLLVPDLAGFTELPAQLVVRFPPTHGNVYDFGKRLIGEGGIDSIPLPPPAAPEPTYIQFDVWLGQGPDCKKSQVRPLAWPYKPEIVQSAPEYQQDVTVNRVDIDFGSDSCLAVLVLRPAGRLLRPRILRASLSH